jgi:hypothetical protein
LSDHASELATCSLILSRGRLTRVLPMGVMKRPQRRDLTTAYHEAGHVVVAHYQKIAVRRATIEPGDGYHGKTESAKFPRAMQPDAEVTVRARLRLECQARIFLAGAIAQRRIASQSMRHWHHQTDYEHAVSFVSYLCSSDRELNAYINLLQIQTEQLVELHWFEIESTLAVSKASVNQQ